MALQRGFLHPAQFQGGWVAIGNFDGVHRGHQTMVARLLEHARSVNGPAVVLTFDPHPIQLLRPEETPPSLSTLERKAQLLSSYGVDVVIAYETDEELLQMSPREFFDRIVIEQLRARGLVEGPNFYFGHRRAGDVRLLGELCANSGLELDVLEPVECDESLISSSLIRQQIAAGQLQQAIELLGHPYQLTGTVRVGDRRGRQLGFPTANLDDIQTIVPGAGVYAGRCVVDREALAAAIHVGPIPTFGGTQARVEVHLIGFEGDLYGRDLAVDFLARLRDIRSFGDPAALIEQLQRDVAEARSLFDQWSDSSGSGKSAEGLPDRLR